MSAHTPVAVHVRCNAHVCCYVSCQLKEDMATYWPTDTKLSTKVKAGCGSQSIIVRNFGTHALH